ncbi:MAG: hypothetical protein K1X94_15870 [Sandaracinaceae bacterium]|jgi:hypothetical protein|nr:hypothetical protein [Sandaracinaceae bacterium]
MQRLTLVLFLLLASLAHSTRSHAQSLTAPPSTSLTRAQIDRCYRVIYQGLRPIARVEVHARRRDALVFALIARAPCPVWSARVRELARLVMRGDRASRSRVLDLIDDHPDEACTGRGGSSKICAPHHIEVRGVEPSQRPSEGGTRQRAVLVRAVDALSAHPDLVPLAQLLWGFGDYDGRCETWDLVQMHGDVRRGHVRRELYQPPPGRTRARIAARLYGPDDPGTAAP